MNIQDVIAKGEFIVLSAIAKPAGSEIYSTSIEGMVTGYRETGEIPLYCVVHSIGELVPTGFVEVGDIVPTPMGGAGKNVLHPEAVMKTKQAKDIDEKFMTIHYTHIPAVYKTEK